MGGSDMKHVDDELGKEQADKGNEKVLLILSPIPALGKYEFAIDEIPVGGSCHESESGGYIFMPSQGVDKIQDSYINYSAQRSGCRKLDNGKAPRSSKF
jgi:hypothetical protein